MPLTSSEKDTLLIDEAITIHRKKGNGVIRRQIWQNKVGEITRYSLAYINHHLFQGDNGRVIGYDNAHGYRHKHHFGKVEPIQYSTFGELEIQFQQEFEVLHAQITKKS